MAVDPNHYNLMLLESEIPSYHVATPTYKGAENFRDANTLGVLKMREGLNKGRGENFIVVLHCDVKYSPQRSCITLLL